MAITNYTELKSSLADWLNRSDLTSRIPEFISLAEAAFNRNLRTRDMLSRSTTSTNAQYVALPSDFLEMLNVELPSYVWRPYRLHGAHGVPAGAIGNTHAV